MGTISKGAFKGGQELLCLVSPRLLQCRPFESGYCLVPSAQSPISQGNEGRGIPHVQAKSQQSGSALEDSSTGAKLICLN